MNIEPDKEAAKKKSAKWLLRIGGVDVAISAAPSLSLRIANPLYRPFLAKATEGNMPSRIPLRLIHDRWPEGRRLEKIFDTQDSWSMGRDQKHFWIRLAPRPQEDPLWIARFDRLLKRVDLYCRSVPRGRGGERIVDLPLVYPLDQLLLMYYLAWRKGILLHAAGMVRDGKAYLFAGASGAGKSTLSQLLAAARAGKLLSDERMIVRQVAGNLLAFGTPWAGTAGIARSGSAPLAGIFFLEHGKSNQVERLAVTVAADRLLPLASVPWYDPDTMSPIIAFSKRLAAKVPAFEMSFTPDRSGVETFRRFIQRPSGSPPTASRPFQR
jgi:hypothetical protein